MPVKGVFITYSFQEKRAHQAMQGYLGKHQAWSEGRRGERNACSEPLLCFPQEGRLSSGTALGLDGLNNFSGRQIWGWSLPVQYLALG